jgi:Fe-S-cluster containining protein
LEVLSTKHNGRPTLEPDTHLYGEALKAYRQRLFMCPFNAGDGSCGIYPIRPVVCRTFYVADSCECCSLNSNGDITIIRHAKLTEIALLARQFLRELSAAAGNDSLSALPAAVEQAMAIMQGDC